MPVKKTCGLTEGRRTHPVLAADIGRRHAGLPLFQHRDDLFLAEPRSLHRPSERILPQTGGRCGAQVNLYQNLAGGTEIKWDLRLADGCEKLEDGCEVYNEGRSSSMIGDDIPTITMHHPDGLTTAIVTRHEK